ncbi:MAG: hypothetical protein RBT67_06795 [Thauera sp.]|jgi:hypothetical protein|nr:hypothetical protein [Thauera sp.]
MPEQHRARLTGHHLTGHRRPATLLLRATAIACISLAGCTGLHDRTTSPGAIVTAPADASAHEAAQERLHAAVQALQPGQARLQQARRALEGLLADGSTEARAHHPYARALLEQIRERQRLIAHNEQLVRERDAAIADRDAKAQTLEAALAEALLARDALQHKLDALGEIERRLPAPATPGLER